MPVPTFPEVWLDRHFLFEKMNPPPRRFIGYDYLYRGTAESNRLDNLKAMVSSQMLPPLSPSQKHHARALEFNLNK